MYVNQEFQLFCVDCSGQDICLIHGLIATKLDCDNVTEQLKIVI